ncbi:MAG TPA: PAS domain-containing sensor histidine kinase [Williamwhitmania sp.]|nr:PAS domain-containing sensor histidine kinase [Williamwhitmania sp.]
MAKSRIGIAYSYLAAEDKILSLENRLYLSAIVLAIVISVVATSIVLVISPSTVALVTNLVLLGSLLTIYWFARFRDIMEPLKIPIVVVSFLGIFTIWVFDGGINSPDMMIALVVLMLALLIVPYRVKKYVISLFIALIVVVYLIQLLRPDLIVKIPSETFHWFDNFLTALYSSLFIFLIIRFVHRHYTNERQRAEVLLSKFRSYVESAPDGVFVINAAGFYVDVNMAACELLGYSREEILTMHASQMSIQENSRGFKVAIFALQTTGKYSRELTLLRKDGSTFTGELSAVKIDENQYLGFVKDVTEQKQAEREITMLANALKSISDCVSITDTENNIIFVNESFIKTYGYTEDELEGKHISMITSPNNSSTIVDEILVATLSGGWKGELLNVRKDGSEFTVSLSTSIVYDENYAPIALIGVSSDITKLKQEQDELVNLNNQLRELNADKDRFLSILAHDLKTPFNSLIGFSELLLNNIDNYDKYTIKSQVKIINETAKSTFGLLEDTLLWARAQSGKLPFNPQKVNFLDICSEVVESLKRAADAKNINIKQFAEENFTLFADVEMLKTVLRNLISNAIKFTNSGGDITLYAVSSGGEVVINVSDNGVGIKPAEIANLFDTSTFSSTTGTAGEKGTGLGLLLCKDFVEKNSGHIWVESEEGRGTIFKFTMPLVSN